MSLQGKTVVIIGGSSGIGFATARATIATGAHVVITGRSPARLQAASAELAGAVRTAALDANDEAGTRDLFASLARVDHLFVSAATVSFGLKLTSPTAELRPSLETRFWGSLYAVRECVPKMPPDGSITFTSGVAAWRPLPGGSVGSASCGAIEAYARALAVELGPIRVNTIAPGLIDTPLIAAVMGERAPEILKHEGERLPVRRVGRPEDIADAVVFLMSNGFTTGITLTVDGGRSLV
jgi:NAD(P)-dependent dehydrogenase (short-subunit alcohol dehydrogenase family)